MNDFYMGNGLPSIPQGTTYQPSYMNNMPYTQSNYAMPYSMNGQAMKTPAATNVNIHMFIYQLLISNKSVNVPFEALEFVAVSEPFASQDMIRHACKFNLLAIECLHPVQVSFYDKATVDFAFCANCLRVIYHVEKF